MRKLIIKTINLFEYKWLKPEHKEILEGSGFELFLDNIWKNRPKSEGWYSKINQKNKTEEKQQRFLRFRKNELSPRNFVGVIQYNNTEINLLPKIFYHEKYDDGETPDNEELKKIHLHILYWLSYNKKLHFPKSFSNLASIEINSFFEILILMFATYTNEVLSQVIYQNYHEENKDNTFLKGHLDVKGYIKNNLTTGNWQRITCEYDLFDMDNLFNRIIKYVSKLLLAHTQSSESQKLLDKIIFILDDVEDAQMNFEDCKKVHINPFYIELSAVLDYCKLFLSNSMVYSYKDEFEVFAFLLPMEKIFEEYVVGILKENPNNLKIKNMKIQSQKPVKHLSSNIEAFKMKPDIYLTNNNNSDYHKIIDTKYKTLKNNYIYNGVSQSDMYQMVSYGIRYEVDDIILLYPATVGDSVDTDEKYKPISEYQVTDKFVIIPKDNDEKQTINIQIHKLPIILGNNFMYNENNYSKFKKCLDEQVSKRLEYML